MNTIGFQLTTQVCVDIPLWVWNEQGGLLAPCKEVGTGMSACEWSSSIGSNTQPRSSAPSLETSHPDHHQEDQHPPFPPRLQDIKEPQFTRLSCWLHPTFISLKSLPKGVRHHSPLPQESVSFQGSKRLGEMCSFSLTDGTLCSSGY